MGMTKNRSYGVSVEQLNALEQREAEYWRDSEHENPESNSVHNLVNKMFDLGILLNLLKTYEHEFTKIRSSRVLELGGGQGWGSCLVKRLFSDTHVTLTDISPFAVRMHKLRNPGGSRLNRRCVLLRLGTSFPCPSKDPSGNPQDSASRRRCYLLL